MSLRACLDGQLVGLYLCGSAVPGDFDVNASDLDVIAVTTCQADDLDLRRIGKALTRIERRHPAWAGRIEVAHVGKGTLQTFRDGGPLVVVSPGEPLHLTDGAKLWTANWYLARRASLALFGPAPETIVPPVSTREFLEAIARYAAAVPDRDLAAMTPAAVPTPSSRCAGHCAPSRSGPRDPSVRARVGSGVGSRNGRR